MTEGSIQKSMITFAIPLFISNLFQQLYNTADSLIVGNFLGSEALASVSSSGNLIFLLIGFFNGISMGAGVVIARYYGARDPENARGAIHTTVAVGLVAGIILTLLGFFLAPQILIWMGTPASIMQGSTLYFRVYFLGSLAFVMYNVSVGVLQAMGDSRHPMYYLITSSCINIVLDLLFVGLFKMSVGGAALATVISQFVSATLGMIRLFHQPEEYRVRIKEIRFTGVFFKQILYNGLPAGIQNSITSFANVIVQSNINAFGDMAVAGHGVYSKIEGFAFLPITCFMMALTTFISQNIGAQKYDRVKKGARFGVLTAMIMSETIGVIVFFAAPYLMAMFDRNPEVIAFGVQRAKCCAFFYCLLAMSHTMAGVQRGAGRAIVPMGVMMVCWCVIRVTYLTVTMPIFHSIYVVNWAYPITWSLSALSFLVFYLKGDWVYGRNGKPAKA